MKKPEPVPTATVCSLCGLAWDSHGEKPTAEECVELLKAELARRPKFNQFHWQGTTGAPFQQLGSAS